MKNLDSDALARLLDGDLPDGEATAEARALGALASVLSASARMPEMEHKADLRAALVEAAREQAAAPTLLARLRGAFGETTSRWRYSARLAAATGASAMALSTGGVALAAHRSTPSHPVFYNVKLAYEDIRVALIADPVARGEALLAYADQRLVEAEAAAAAGDMDAARRALAEADINSRSGARYIIQASQDQGDPSLLAILDKWAGTHRKRLAALLPHLSGEAASAAEDAMVGLRRIDQRLAVLSGPCSECGFDAADANDRKDRKDGAEKVAAADPDFDFADIPPASEPFAPCPCVPDDGDTGTAAEPKRKVDKKTAKGKKAIATEPAAGRAPTDEPASGAGDPGETGGDPTNKDPGDSGPRDEPGDEPGDESPADSLPEPVRKPVKDAEDVVKDVIKNPPSPTPLPPLPTPDLPDVPDLLP